jgi:hypothetical protein
MWVRGVAGGGGFDVVGCPSASRNLRIRSSSDSAGARGSSGGADVGLCPGSCDFLFDSPALLASNLSKAAIAMSRMKRRLSKCMITSSKR